MVNHASHAIIILTDNMANWTPSKYCIEELMYMYSKWVVKYILISLNKAVCFGVYHTYNDGNKFYYLFYLYSVTQHQ